MIKTFSISLLPAMTPDSVHLLTRSSQMSLFRDEQGNVRRAYYGPRLHEPQDALAGAADAPLVYATLADSLTGLPNASDIYESHKYTKTRSTC